MRGWSCVRCGGIEAAEEEEEDDHREKSILFVCLFVCLFLFLGNFYILAVAVMLLFRFGNVIGRGNWIWILILILILILDSVCVCCSVSITLCVTVRLVGMISISTRRTQITRETHRPSYVM